MLLRKCIVALVLVALIAIMATAQVSAASAGYKKTDTKGYVVTVDKKPSTSSFTISSGLISPMASYQNWITQGDHQYAQKTITGYYTSFPVELYWGNPVNSLSLKIYTPDGAVLGPFYDNIDGRINGDIPLIISRSSGISQGTYYFEIYGDRVSGWQSYTLYA